MNEVIATIFALCVLVLAVLGTAAVSTVLVKYLQNAWRPDQETDQPS
jgi:hypothetical protein